MKPKIYTRDNLVTFDQATMDSAGAFLVGELERLDPTMHMPLADVTWHRDIDIRTDVTIGDELSSFTNSTFAAVGGTSPTGKAWIGKNSNAVPGISLDIGKTGTPLILWGMELGYTIPELVSAMQAGRPLDSQKLEAIRLKYNMDVDQQVYVGDTDLGLYGLVNNPNVTASNVVNGASSSPLWANKTPQEILTDVRSLEQAVWTSSAYAAAPRQVLVPPTKYVYLLQPLTVNGVGYQSVLEYISRNSVCLQVNGVPLEILPAKWLVGAGVGGTDRMAAYTRQLDRVRFPMTPLMNTPVEHRGLYKLTTYYGRLGAVEVVYPEAMGYRDGF